MTDRDDREREAQLARARLAGLHGDGSRAHEAAEDVLAAHTALHGTTDDTATLVIRSFKRLVLTGAALGIIGYVVYGVLSSYLAH